MKAHKWTSLLMTMVLTTGVLTACGTKKDTNQASSPAPAASAAPVDPAKLSGTLSLWTFFDGTKGIATAFEKKYPNVKVDVKVFPGDQYQIKLLSALQSGKDVPDVLDLERSYVGKFIESPFLMDLTSIGANDLVKGYIPYVSELGKSSDGKMKAISDQSSPGGFWYLKENAKKYLGTDDSAKISEMVNSYDKMIELGKKVAKDSDGKVHLIANSGDLFDIAGYNTQPFYLNGKLNIDPKWEQVYNSQKNIRANNVDAKLPFMSAGWGNALNDGSVVLTAMPAWATFMIGNKDNKAAGKYGVAKTPEGFYNGGTFRAIYSKTPNKEIAAEFIKFSAGSEWQSADLAARGNMPALQSVYESNSDKYTSPLTGDQKVLQPYYEMMKSMPVIKSDKYSDSILSLWRKVAGQGVTDNKSYADVVTAFQKEVKAAFPELQ
ncbi:multiple sugar transport system substrate-binding protein [Bacillus sp. 3255]|nr:multiple sugar transport system substrate-binding protein [Bacillus sp. 3255]